MIITRIFFNAFKPGYLSVMLIKLARRIKRKLGPEQSSSAEILDWCASRAGSFEDFAYSISPDLLRESASFATEHKAYARRRLSELGVSMGGGGHYELLFFMVRLLHPATVLETGVAAGHSSRAVLTALHRNGGGKLLSSDFPYFRMRDPEKNIGILVEEGLRANWHLEIKGDEVSIPILLEKLQSIDLFHYDSDKSEEGRARALEIVWPRLTDDAVLIFDDIQDNFHFQKLAKRFADGIRIFEFHGKFVGVIFCGDSLNHSEEQAQ